MCEKASHEILCPGVIYCTRTGEVTVWVSKLRKALGVMYADMSTEAIVTPVVAACIDQYPAADLKSIRVIMPGAMLRLERGCDDEK